MSSFYISRVLFLLILLASIFYSSNLPCAEENTNTWEWEDPSPSKLIGSQTAFLQEKGTLDFNFRTVGILNTPPFVFNFFDFSYGMTKNFAINLSTYIPFMYLGFGIYPKFGFKITKYMRIGFMADFGVAWNYLEENSKYSLLLFYGGAPLLLTIGSRDYFLNLSLHINGSYTPHGNCLFVSDECTDTISNHLVLAPSIGASIRISRRLKINFDLLYIYRNIDVRQWSEIDTRHLLSPMIGLKIFGKIFYGSINMAMCFVRDIKGEKKWFPIPLYVFPMVSFGWIHS